MKKVAVLGATGMAGHVISLYLEENGFEVYRMSRSIVPSTKNAQIDASDFDKLNIWLKDINPDFVINAIGILPKEADARPDIAILLNSYLPHMLERVYMGKSTKIIHLSTDCVFSGSSGGYTESSPTDGMTMYDRSKALGEILNEKDLTFRMSIIGPDITINGVGLFNWFMKQKGEINGFTKAIWNGVTTIELSKAIVAAIKQNLTGLYHLTPQKNINKYDLLQLFKKEFAKQDVEIIPFDDFVVDKTLINTRSDFDYQIPPYHEMIHEMALWVKKYKGMYQYE
ncbi:dTDP-4-dehydrorhamnose reductase family protein [Paenibacillus elgii]